MPQLTDKAPLPIRIAYCAGIIDGEGCIRVKKSRPNKANGCVSPGYHVVIQVRMVDEPAIKFVAETLGGNYHKERQWGVENRRPLYCYAASNLIAVKALQLVLPYLLVKKDSAENALAFAKLKSHSRLFRTKPNGLKNFPNLYKNRLVPKFILSDEYLGLCEKFYLRSKKFNRVGAAAMADD